MLTDQGSQFTSQMLEELFLEFKMKNATAKHAQTIGALKGPLAHSNAIYEFLKTNCQEIGINL